MPTDMKALEQRRKQSNKDAAGRELASATAELAKELLWKPNPTPTEERFLQAVTTYAMASA